ncbi:MAG: RNA methyltransferase [Thermoanaerobaculia bacterium]|nr:RNA methyltransferase [Thermoanaerobaculia bacterium]
MRRSKGDRALLEGPHLLEEAVDAKIEIEYVLATPDGLAERRSLFERLTVPVHTIRPDILERITDADSPRGSVAVARLPRGDAEQLPPVERGVYVYAVGLQDPGNLGAVARVAEASGAAALAIAPDSVHPNHPRALRGSAGSLLRLPVAVGVTVEALSDRLAAVDPRWIALTAEGGAHLYSTPLEPPLVLALGAERGLDRAVEAHCDLRLAIPMEPPVDSLNTAVAAALTLYEIRFGRNASR